MSKPQTFFWLPSSLSRICPEQNVTQNGFLTFSSDFMQAGNQCPSGARTLLCREKSLIKAPTLLITGSCNGVLIQEKLEIGLKDAVESVQVFDMLQSIQVLEQKATQISVSWGIKGHTPWFLFDYQRAFPSLSVQVQILKGTVTYSLVGTLTDVAQKKENEIPLFPIGDPALTDKRETALSRVILTPLRYTCVQILESNEAAALEITFLQQGVT